MKKIKAHYIFDGSQFHKFGTLVLDDSNRVLEILPESKEEHANTEFYSGIVCPGFVNAHCHLELSHLHNSIPQHTGLPEFISHVVRLRNSVEDREVYMRQADANMQEQGIVAVCDISNTTESFAVKQSSSIKYHTCIEMFDIFSDTQQVFRDAKQIFSLYKSDLSLSLSLHAPYSCSRILIELLGEHAKEYEYPISIHNQEDASENDFFVSQSGELYTFFKTRNPEMKSFQGKGKSSLQTIAPLLPRKNHILFVHNIFTNYRDVRFLLALRSQRSFTFVICPLSNFYISKQVPPLPLFLEKGISVAIGTDSFASNTKLSILDELIYLQEIFPEISLEKLLECATKNGAFALGMQRTLGSFVKGAKPGVLLLEQCDLHSLRLTKNTRIHVLV